MCGGGPDLPSEKDPKAEREAAAAEATQSANSKAALARRQKQQQSLMASGAPDSRAVSTNSVLAQGKDKLGN